MFDITKFITLRSNRLSNLNESTLILDNVTKEFTGNGIHKSFKIKNVNITINPNQSIVYLGNNGSGKTTLFRLIVGSVLPDNGKVHTKEYNLLIGYSSSDGSDLNPLLRINQIVNMLSEYYPKNEVINFLNELEFTEYFNKRINLLSSGMKKKLSLFRALLLGVDLILLDEPEAHLDYKYRSLFSKIITKIQEIAPILLVSHDEKFVINCNFDSYNLIYKTEAPDNVYSIKNITDTKEYFINN